VLRAGERSECPFGWIFVSFFCVTSFLPCVDVVKTGAFAKKDEVRCKAIRFDNGPDPSTGRTFSQSHVLAGHGAWVAGTIVHLHADKNTPR
jgi:hypothetical protein